MTSPPSSCLAGTKADNCDYTTLLTTAQVDVSDGFGKYQTVRVLLDNASQVARLPKHPTTIIVNGLGEMSSKFFQEGCCVVKPKGLAEALMSLKFIVTPKICDNIPNIY